MLMMSPLPVEDKTLDLSAQLTELTGFVYDAARAGLPAHELERGVWTRLLQLGHDLEAAYVAWAGDGDGGATLTLNHGRVVKRLPTRHSPTYVALAAGPPDKVSALSTPPRSAMIQRMASACAGVTQPCTCTRPRAFRRWR